MTLPVKLGVGTLALGSTVGAGYGAVTYFSQENKEANEGKSIKSLINEKFEYVFLSFDETNNTDEDIWKEKWTTYKSENSNRDADILGVSGWTKNSQSESTKELKAKCKELSEKLVYDEGKAHYEKVTKYCSRETTAEDEAIRKGLSIITGKDENTWKSKTDKKNALAPNWKTLGFEGTEFTATNLDTKCAEAKKKQRKSVGYTAFYEAYKFVCTSHSISE